MSEQVKQNELQDTAMHGTVATYVAGFVLSVALTLVAYVLVVNQALTSRLLLGAIVTLAVVQFVVQMVFFLHLGRERRPRFNLVVFGFMLVVLLILVLGTLWIMTHLDYYTASQPEALEQQIIEDEGY